MHSARGCGAGPGARLQKASHPRGKKARAECVFIRQWRAHTHYGSLCSKFACCDLIQLCSAPMKAPFCPHALLANQKFLFSRRFLRKNKESAERKLKTECQQSECAETCKKQRLCLRLPENWRVERRMIDFLFSRNVRSIGFTFHC